ncbi:hypothetical protein niasHT_032832 [Heterodera trifolii]|uniref:Phorbol-ester/DAG-type domain-containing protein n=1 Tax=Heterodera trifolii TaxID=157864 RepID=A0ABD2IR38_9BILA
MCLSILLCPLSPYLHPIAAALATFRLLLSFTVSPKERTRHATTESQQLHSHQQQKQQPYFQLPHSLWPHNYRTPTVCKVCDKLLMGVFKQGLRCKDCRALQQSLQPPPLRTDPANAEPALQFSQIYQVHREKVLGSGQFGTVYSGVHRQSGREVAVKVIAKDRFSKKSSAVETLKSEQDNGGATEHKRHSQQQAMEVANPSLDAMIPLARLPGEKGASKQQKEGVVFTGFYGSYGSASLRSVRHAAAGQPLCEGWLIHFLLQEKERRRLRHYWVLANGVISLYNEYNDGVNTSRVFRHIHLAEIVALIPYEGLPIDPNADAVDLIQYFFESKSIEERLTIDECIGHRWLKYAQTYWDLICLEKRLGHRYLTSEAEDLIWAPQLSAMGLIQTAVTTTAQQNANGCEAIETTGKCQRTEQRPMEQQRSTISMETEQQQEATANIVDLLGG